MTMQLRILDQNFAFNSTCTVSASSSDASFPVSNLTKFQRSRVWRSSGNFIITTGSNDKMNFKETGGGPERTGTIAAGTYTATTLAAAIKTALEGATGATGVYTVTYSTLTGKWTIATSLAFLSLLTNTGTNVATSVWSSIGFSVAADQTGALTYTGASVAIHTEESIVIDLSTTDAVDSFAFLFNPMTTQGNKFSQSAVLKLQANATNSWASPSVDVTLSADTVYDVITHFFSADQNYRYWRLKIVDPTNAYLYVEVSKLLLAKSTQLTQLPESGFSISSKDLSKVISNDYGHEYTDLYPSQMQIQFSYKTLTSADVESLRTVYARVGRATPLGLALDPTESLFDKDRFFIYGKMKEDFKAGNVFLDYFDSGLSVEEML
jgi:hypothetical protein